MCLIREGQGRVADTFEVGKSILKVSQIRSDTGGNSRCQEAIAHAPYSKVLVSCRMAEGENKQRVQAV